MLVCRPTAVQPSHSVHKLSANSAPRGYADNGTLTLSYIQSFSKHESRNFARLAYMDGLYLSAQTSVTVSRYVVVVLGLEISAWAPTAWNLQISTCHHCTASNVFSCCAWNLVQAGVCSLSAVLFCLALQHVSAFPYFLVPCLSPLVVLLQLFLALLHAITNFDTVKL